MVDIELTQEESKAIASFERLAKKWPKSLWLFVGEGVAVMRKDESGNRVMVEPFGGVDQDYCVCTIMGIEADGGGH